MMNYLENGVIYTKNADGDVGPVRGGLVKCFGFYLGCDDTGIYNLYANSSYGELVPVKTGYTSIEVAVLVAKIFSKECLI